MLSFHIFRTVMADKQTFDHARTEIFERTFCMVIEFQDKQNLISAINSKWNPLPKKRVIYGKITRYGVYVNLSQNNKTEKVVFLFMHET